MELETSVKTAVDDQEEAMRLIKKHTYLLPRTKLGWTLTVIVIISFLMVYPGLIWANTAYPFLFGMPFTYVWLTFWVHVMLVAGIYAARKLWV
ncbi:hypothetical protein T458_21305 [Brevibacillus panacihumi W25]|uniref:Uncharacterized protein n=1 Tax=Brevibacillus panacihumi W25 TaxID=1408254 RepID=V6M450_9BACL|nr:hypothetical protein [Brevibacillus panacihumi]EST53364.1 hypothetical protein T458_21305 [Brevibacillus panacihumi W25]